jgi:protein SCO1/2
MDARVAGVAWKRSAAAALLAAAAGALLAFGVAREPSPHEAHAPLDALEQTLLRLVPGEPVALPALVTSDGQAVSPERLHGRWSVVFFGFTACPDVCPTALQVLSAASRDPASGVASGATQIVFISVDPDTDTPDRIRRYLENFDRRIVGLTGSREALQRFTAAAGADYQARADGIDHSTSLFVIDPEGRLAGILLRPADPARIAADLKSLRGAGG